jgi:methylmalonyl-CoA/ethylmalonyl-CoA epimerase
MVDELRLALTVQDFDEAVAFYRDRLGLPMLDMWVAPGARGVILDAGRATLELLDEGQAQVVDEIEVGRRVAGPVRIALRVADSATLAEQLEAFGATRLGGPVTTPWQDVNVRLEAPDGLLLTLFSATDE